MEDKMITLPVIALRGLTVLPGMSLHFDISRPKSVKAVEKAMMNDQRIGLFTQVSPDEAEPDENGLYRIGTVAAVKQLIKLPGGMVRVMVEGIYKAELTGLDTEKPALIGEIEPALINCAEKPDPAMEEAMCRVLKDQLEEYGRNFPQMEKELVSGLILIQELDELLKQIAIQFPWDYTVRQKILETEDTTECYELIVKKLIDEINIMMIKKELSENVKKNISQNQKEYFLREQLKVIHEELGDDNTLSDADEYLKQVDALKADKEVREKLKKEISRFRTMPSGMQEANVLRTYIETALELPWNKVSRDNRDLRHAEQILNEDHYGLEKVKERILEYLAVRSLTRKGTSPIICLVGPPGTGKTSIARSVARALDKKYVRISLGGVRDEAEIRGHRKTYVGAMPGRIVEGLLQAQVSNPLMLLDEIDKVSSDYKGDTSSALLEVLDGEQNVKFRDHYIEVPIDLSRVLFIATANTTQTIPEPLLDRMELIEVNSYTENEKFHIAVEHLLKKQMEKNGLNNFKLDITEPALKKIIHNYTREAGVRNLEREIGGICRKAARQFLEDKNREILVTEKNLEEYLGKEKISFDNANEKDDIGIVRGLAWTSVGGDTLQIEVNVMPGKDDLKLTGQMGDVMKESAQTALSYVRSVASEYGVKADYFERHDLHIHIPEGAVPKDGPSAGITMATAMLSAVTGMMVHADTAMTGEITLRGRVLPIGGLKEKILAAKMAHIKKVLVPAKNRPDIEELTDEITDGLLIIYVSSMEDVLKEALVVKKSKRGEIHDH